MNILHLKYAVEIDKTHSLNKAAENLYIAQPNLSRAIKELEDSLGITIFDRTRKGMIVTPEGEGFLQHAKKILKQIEEVESIYAKGKKSRQVFSVSVPRASYISHAFVNFAELVTKDEPIDLFYRETNSSQAINNILQSDYKLGIIRYASNYDKYFKEMLDERDLAHEMITEFTYVLVLSKDHPLADKTDITFDDLAKYVEITHADPFVPHLSVAAIRKEELPDNVEKRIFVFERAIQFELLGSTPGTFMWISPMPGELLEKHNLVQRKCKDNTKIYKDVLIHKKDYNLRDIDNLFIEEVFKAKRLYL